jgi:putative transcriptional regulator
MANKKVLGRLAGALVEMAGDQYRLGMMDEATYGKITLRHLGPNAPDTAKPITAAEIRGLRERANLSQAAFARYLNLTAGYISQLERGEKEPRGAALTLFNVIRRKGMEAVL